jgi:hypothetical protein
MTNLNISNRFLQQSTKSQDQFKCFPHIFAAVDYVTLPNKMKTTDFCGSRQFHDQFKSIPQIFAAVDHAT